jgi:hypothetical protein
MIIKHISFVVISFLALSCSPQQRIARIVSRHPDAIVFDSTRLTTTLILPGTTIPLKFSIDTITSLRSGDTIRVDSTKVQVTITQHNDSIAINIYLLPDTVRTDTTLATGTINVTRADKRTFTRFDWILLILSLLTLIALLRFLFPGKNKT